uniref:cytochrome c oxidase subunit II n=1 Tax=Tropilaelaps mercedesae TaxID=418985 RepID=UPI0028D2908C|nr:cytochrome c oxidase subunit II [Tropilaelaps mercedesae]WMV02013.1 cytochrome c oxidase subunit II [Tropilaelaps mercedesae]
MTFWSSIFFPNANSPLMEQMIFFHDHTMIIIISIMTFISYILIYLFNNKLYNRYLTENHEIEIIWTLIPSCLLIFIALPSLHLLYLIEENFSPAITIKILGHQWYWSYELSDFNIEFDSFMLTSDYNFRLLETDNNLVIPFSTNIRFLISSTDVIHSWTIPSLGLKIDAIPGRLNQLFTFTHRPGMYFGQCSEICGSNHSFMPISMEITSLKNFSNWVKNF